MINKVTDEKKIKYLLERINELKQINEQLSSISDKEIRQKANQAYEDYVEECDKNLKEIKKLRNKYRKLVEELEIEKADYEVQIKEIGLRKRPWFRLRMKGIKRNG